MRDKKTVWFSTFTKVVPADYEQWLEQLAQEGWHVEHIGQWSSIAMTFHRGQPKKYRYVFDLQAFPKPDYRATYEQFGWELVGQMASCYIWRKEYIDQRPESFSNSESREKRNKNVLAAVSVSFIALLVLTIILLLTFLGSFAEVSSGYKAQYIISMGFLAAFACYLGAVMRKIYKKRWK
ncbi:MAG: DUF2812 domain-containing protein [Bacillota bacterium]|jgi:hypothetical protein